jgi:hypothetical protein
MSGPIHADQRTNGQRHYERKVVDVSTEQECPKRILDAAVRR